MEFYGKWINSLLLIFVVEDCESGLSCGVHIHDRPASAMGRAYSPLGFVYASVGVRPRWYRTGLRPLKHAAYLIGNLRERTIFGGLDGTG